MWNLSNNVFSNGWHRIKCYHGMECALSGCCYTTWDTFVVRGGVPGPVRHFSPLLWNIMWISRRNMFNACQLRVTHSRLETLHANNYQILYFPWREMKSGPRVLDCKGDFVGIFYLPLKCKCSRCDSWASHLPHAVPITHKYNITPL